MENQEIKKVQTWLERDLNHKPIITKNKAVLRYKNAGPHIRKITIEVNVNSIHSHKEALEALKNAMQHFLVNESDNLI
ncbi:hypothetical protein [Pedobacter cryophilus]|uniref:Uncharacterized protein n=1 Tax=Pedobacter cryophilus TaxID=2571271 RepID=A0A4U1BX14_9SPHI|nr:hypothetical protein [Pedobacter cryophilus]TKB96871.1 hypothetical protein FA046_12395 [Pedobacter cryophilus]